MSGHRNFLFGQKSISGSTTQFCDDSSEEACSKLDCRNFPEEARTYCPKTCGLCRICEDTLANCSTLAQNHLCTANHVLSIAAEHCPRSCNFCSPCSDTDSRCSGLINYCEVSYVMESCRKSCRKCKAYNSTEIIEKYKGHHTQTTRIVTSSTTEALTSTTLQPTSVTAFVSRNCDRDGVKFSIAMEDAVSYAGASTCPDRVHQPTAALVQKYCGAPNIQNWLVGEKVMDHCQNIPHYTAIAAVTATFGGTLVAGVFIKCETNGFQVAIQTCQSPLQLYHVTTNATANIPSSGRFVLINWKN